MTPSLGNESSRQAGRDGSVGGGVVYVLFSLWLRDGMGMDMQLGEAILRCLFCEFGRLMTARYCRPDL